MKNISDMIHHKASLNPRPPSSREDIIAHAKTERAHVEHMWDIRARGKKCKRCFDTGYREGFITDDLINPYSFQTFATECECGALTDMAAQVYRKDVPQRPIDSFVLLKPHHEPMLKIAKRFISQESDKWLFVGGEVGSGKTHLCEAVINELFEKTKLRAHTIKWRDFAKKSKQDPTSDILLMEVKAVPILYIDDFLKAGGDKVTEADINIAYDIVDGRMRTGKWTIISSEYTLEGMRNIDKSVASRIAEMTKDYAINVQGEGKDVRWG